MLNKQQTKDRMLAERDRLVGRVVKSSAPKAEGPEFESRLRRDFSASRQDWHSSGHPARHLAL